MPETNTVNEKRRRTVAGAAEQSALFPFERADARTARVRYAPARSGKTNRPSVLLHAIILTHPRAFVKTFVKKFRAAREKYSFFTNFSSFF